MKLSKFNLFKKQTKELSPVEYKQDCEILRTYLTEMFPSASRIELNQSEVDLNSEINDFIIANITPNEKHPNNVFDEDELPFHTRDNAWLVKYLTQKIKTTNKENKWVDKTLQKINKKAQKNYPSYIELENDNQTVNLTKRANLGNINPESIKRFVETDQEFDEARNDYEVDLVRAQIKHMMDSTEPNGLLFKDKFDITSETISQATVYHPAITRFKPDADLYFYNGVMVAMHKLGISKHSAQVGLEKYAPLWRDELMLDAYFNRYNQYTTEPVSPKETTAVKLEKWHIDAVNQNFKGLWLRNREYEYYQAHKTIIDELNAATPNMKISEKQAATLSRKVANIDQEYQNIINSRENHISFDFTLDQKL